MIGTVEVSSHSGRRMGEAIGVDQLSCKYGMCITTYAKYANKAVLQGQLGRLRTTPVPMSLSFFVPCRSIPSPVFYQLALPMIVMALLWCTRRGKDADFFSSYFLQVCGVGMGHWQCLRQAYALPQTLQTSTMMHTAVCVGTLGGPSL